MTTVLALEDLRVSALTGGEWVPVVDSVGLTIEEGATRGLVGESGSGKTLTGLSLLGLTQSPTLRVESGTLRFKDRRISLDDEKAVRRLRGRGIALIFQDPMSSLNPAFTIGEQVAEAVRLHGDRSRSAARDNAIELLEKVGIPDAKSRFHSYPHEFSGGMRQRVMISIALACQPDVLIADEPTTGLDVTTQAQILTLLQDLADERGMSMLFISHDLAVVADIADEVTVMYSGQVVEQGPTAAVLKDPLHPYTHGLLRSAGDFGNRQAELHIIPGQPPAPGSAPTGCRFRDRCAFAEPQCSQPIALRGRNGREARCVRMEELDLRVMQPGDGIPGTTR